MRKRKSSKFRFLLLIILITIPLIFLGKKVYKLLTFRQEEINLKRKISILQAENEVLIQRITEYKKWNLLEVKARDDLGMIKKGEKIYLVNKK